MSWHGTNAGAGWCWWWSGATAWAHVTNTVYMSLQKALGGKLASFCDSAAVSSLSAFSCPGMALMQALGGAGGGYGAQPGRSSVQPKRLLCRHQLAHGRHP